MTRGYDAERLVLIALGGQVVESDDIGTYAVELAHHGWPVLPLAGKIPAIPKAAGGRGVLDATTDPATVDRWWSGRYRGANIGIRPSAGLIVLDIGPRHGGARRLAELEDKHGKLPDTLKVHSGRGDGGVHYYWRRPAGKLTSARLGHGLDVKTSAGYLVAPPSVHPDTRRPHRWEHHPVVDPPRWLVDLLRLQVQERITRPARTRQHTDSAGESIADTFSADTSWRESPGGHCHRPIAGSSREHP